MKRSGTGVGTTSPGGIGVRRDGDGVARLLREGRGVHLVADQLPVARLTVVDEIEGLADVDVAHRREAAAEQLGAEARVGRERQCASAAGVARGRADRECGRDPGWPRFRLNGQREVARLPVPCPRPLRSSTETLGVLPSRPM